MKKLFVCAILFLTVHFHSIAQPTGGGPGGDPDVPLGGIEILLLSGGILGIKRLMKKK